MSAVIDAGGYRRYCRDSQTHFRAVATEDSRIVRSMRFSGEEFHSLDPLFQDCHMAPSPPIGPPAHPRRMRRIVFRIMSVLCGTFVGLMLLEVSLRYFPPVQLRIRGSRIALPINQRTVISNTTISTVDAEIVQTRNSLGFRGADPPADFAQSLTLVTVGGSTTECYYLSDDKTWPELLRPRLDRKFCRLWLNNAGLDGHTTFGHQQLLEQYLLALRPKCIIFLIGANDVGLDRSRVNDNQLQKGYWADNLGEHTYFWVVEQSATAALLDNLRRTAQARSAGVSHQNINHAQLKWNELHAVDLSEKQSTEIINHHRTSFLPGYRRRVQALVEQCRRADILPIFMTQPALFGPAKDPQTGVDLSRVAVGELNGAGQWQILELYNSMTREVASNFGVPLIDLARHMPKDSQYYYDYYHFSNAGAVQVADIVEHELSPILSREFPEFMVPAAAHVPSVTSLRSGDPVSGGDLPSGLAPTRSRQPR